MHTVTFLQDLAVVMIVAGLVTILFHRFQQPVVLGYMLAGCIIGPHTPPFSLITGEESIVAIQRNAGNIINPGPDEELQVGDQVLVLGTRPQLDSAKAALSKKSS